MIDLNTYTIQEALIELFQPTMPCPECKGKQVVCSGHIDGKYIFNCWTCSHRWEVK